MVGSSENKTAHGTELNKATNLAIYFLTDTIIIECLLYTHHRRCFVVSFRFFNGYDMSFFGSTCLPVLIAATCVSSCIPFRSFLSSLPLITAAAWSPKCIVSAGHESARPHYDIGVNGLTTAILSFSTLSSRRFLLEAETEPPPLL
jgi:hypothetical protein